MKKHCPLCAFHTETFARLRDHLRTYHPHFAMPRRAPKETDRV
jgi:hypothetical protein